VQSAYTDTWNRSQITEYSERHGKHLYILAGMRNDSLQTKALKEDYKSKHRVHPTFKGHF